MAGALALVGTRAGQSAVVGTDGLPAADTACLDVLAWRKATTVTAALAGGRKSVLLDEARHQQGLWGADDVTRPAGRFADRHGPRSSVMRATALTPMTDPDLRRWLARQTSRAVGHVAYGVVARGSGAIRSALDAAAAQGSRYIIVDAILDTDLVAIGEAAADAVLLSGGSGIALGLPGNFRCAGLTGAAASAWAGMRGPAAALCGSCSTMSRRQIAEHRKRHPARVLDVETVVEGSADAAEYAAWMVAQQPNGLPLAFSSAEPEAIAAAQKRHGKERLAAAVEGFFGDLARRLSTCGIRRLVTAGETSGAVVSALGIASFEIGDRSRRAGLEGRKRRLGAGAQIGEFRFHRLL